MDRNSYGGSPSAQFESMFNHNFAGLIGAKPGMACSYDYAYNQERSRNYSAYCESPETMPSCLYASPARSSPMCGSPCMLTPLSPYLSASPGSTVSHSKENYGMMRDLDVASPPCRRRLNFNNGTSVLEISLDAPVAVAKRNERERNRVKLINMTFQKLRQHLPLMGGAGSKGKSRKLSKVQTLRSAIDYIRELQHQIHKNQQHSQQPHGAHASLHEEFLHLNACSYSSEEDNLADEEDFLEDSKFVYEKYSQAHSLDDMCINSNNNNSNNNFHNAGNNNNNNNNSISINNNDNNNNVSRGVNINGSGVVPESCPSIISFGDEIKFLAEDHQLPNNKISTAR